MQAALALPWLTGCASPPRPGRLQGTIVGQSVKVAHRLRQPQTAASGPWQSDRACKVLILGGGIAGLSVAWRLAQSGVDDLAILELERQVGGNSRAHNYAASWAPWGAHYLPVPTQESVAVRRILSEMGLLLGHDAAGRPVYRELELCAAPAERIYDNGQWEEGLFPKREMGQQDFKQLQHFENLIRDWRSWRDAQGNKAFAIPLERSSRDPKVLSLDQMTMAQWMSQQGFDSQRLLWYVEYCCRDDYGSDLHHTSAWAGIHYFASRDGGGFEPADSEFVWPQGNHALVEFLSRSVTRQIHTGHLVSHLRREANQDWVAHSWHEGQQSWHRWRAPKVVFALPSFLRPYLLGESPCPGLSYSPWSVSNLLLDSTPESAWTSNIPLCWDNVCYQAPSLGYVVATHQTSSQRRAPSVWTHYRCWSELTPGEARKKLLAMNWENFRDDIMAELLPIHPDLLDNCRQLDVMVSGHAMIRPTPGYLWGPHRAALSQARQGLHFAHSDLSGISNFEEACQQGVRAGQEVLQAFGVKYENFER